MGLVRLVSAFALGTFVLLGQPAPAKAPTSAPPPAPGFLRNVEVKGNHMYPSADLVKVIGLKLGQPVTAEDFAAANQRLTDTELFAGVKYEFGFTGKPPQYDLTFNVIEYEQVFPMRFEDLDVPEADLRKYLREHIPLYTDRIPATDVVVKRYRDVIQEFVDQTKPGVKVVGHLSPEDPKQLAVLFRPSTPAATIARVEVSGNKAIATAAILRSVNEVAVGAPYTDIRLKQILDASIKGLYETQGYVGVSFPKIEAEKAKDVKGYLVKVTIEEGPQYKFGPMTFRGGDLSSDDVKSLLKFKVGDIFNGEQVDTFRGNLVSAMKRHGHLDANAEVERTLDEKAQAVKLIFNLAPGPLYTFQTLEIHGLDVESEPVIRKMWGEKEGKPFNPEYPDYFLKKVNDAQLFDNLGNTRSDFSPDDTSHRVTVRLYFKGSSPEERRKEDEKRRRREQGQDPSSGGPPL
jgi:outer membrane protein insertion porin family